MESNQPQRNQTKLRFSKTRLIFLFLWLITLSAFFIPVAYLPTPFNGSASYFSAWGSISFRGGIGPPFVISAFFYVLGLLLGFAALFSSWESSRGLRIASASLNLFSIILLVAVLDLFSHLDCNPCYSPVIDVGFLVFLSAQILYILGAIKLRE